MTSNGNGKHGDAQSGNGNGSGKRSLPPAGASVTPAETLQPSRALG